MSPPIVVEVHRGGFVESRHEVDAVIVEGDGHQSGWGNPTRPVLARSSMKPLQALPLVITGASDALNVSVPELALACGSHSGEAVHVDAVGAWLDRLGFAAEDLECGAEPPGNTTLHNSCSGKHTGFLTVCRHLGLDPTGYRQPHHRLQAEHVTPAIEQLCGVTFEGQVPAIDGCGIPVWELPLDRLANGWATLAETPAGQRIFAAMMNEAHMVAGTDRMCTRVMIAGSGEIAVKTGAEGVYCAVAPRAGFAVALKCRDGAIRASEAALLWLLADRGVRIDVEPLPLRNWVGTEVGHLVAQA